MTAALENIRSRFDAEDPYDYDWSSLNDEQLQAVRDLFAQRRGQIRILGQRASETGIEAISADPDIVPLLFADQTYKSYPEVFIKNNQWAMMNRWLDTLSTARIDPTIDVSGVADAETWMDRLRQHDHHPVVSGGTSGKNSFLNRTPEDVRRACESVVRNVGLTQGIKPGAQDRPCILIGPKNGTYIMVNLMRALAEAFARPGQAYWLSEIPLTEADTKRQGELSRKAKDGTATPGELKELKEKAAERQAEMRKSMDDLADALIRHKDEPVMVIGMWLPLWLLMEAARERGLSEGELHPQSTIFSGGGLKGANLPADYREQLGRFFGVAADRYYVPYGMVEMLTGFIQCEHGRYHAPPWVRMLILDQTGERVLEPVNGKVEGRMAFVDLLVEGRWGGIITGDKVDADYTPCACGRRSPGLTAITRYADLPGGDDKLSCAGTMASYIRGEIS
jgi:hypothetical protein